MQAFNNEALFLASEMKALIVFLGPVFGQGLSLICRPLCLYIYSSDFAKPVLWQRITIPEILEDGWFKKDYKPAIFNKIEDTKLDDIEAVFNNSEEHHVTERKEEQPETMNAFKLISMSKALDLGNLFDVEQGFKRETRFTSKCPPHEIISKIEEAAKPLGFDVHKKNYKLKLENMKAGRKGNLSVATEVFQVAPSLHMVEMRKANGDTLEFHKFYKNLSTILEEVVWKTEDNMQQTR